MEAGADLRVRNYGELIPKTGTIFGVKVLTERGNFYMEDLSL